MVIQAIVRKTALVRVRSVRKQNRNGVIFSGERITDTGEIIDTHNGLTVRIQGRRQGVAVAVMPGQWWKVTGLVKRRTYINPGGFEITEDQMEVARADGELRMPSGIHVVDYLTRNPRYEGIGKVTSEHLWETFGEALFDILDDGDTTALADIVGLKKASMLVQCWAEEALSKVLYWLQRFGIGVPIGRRILAYFGQEAVDKISENPYRLLSFTAGWKEVDRLAREQLGVKANDERRLAAAVEETVYRRFSRGHTFVPHRDLVAGLRSILRGEKHSRDLIEQAIAQSEATGRLQFDREGNAYSLGASILENQVVDCIKMRLGRKGPPCDVDRIIKAYENREGNGFTLNKEQRAAIHLIAENDFAVVTGGAGCGKTTVLKCVYDVLEDQGYEITQLALAGKAVKRIMEATGFPAITLAAFIHKMKEAEERGETGKSRRIALVIDEASMVDLISFSGATRLIEETTKIILVGDPNQLPPVGPGLILHCLAERPEIPRVELKTAKRFGGAIATVADSVKNGKFPSLDQFSDEVRFIETAKTKLARLGADLYLEQADDTVVLCATRRVARSINELIQKELSLGRKPLRLWNLEHDTWEYTGFYEGDLIICTRNHWDLGIQNGSLGRLVEVPDASSPDGTDDALPVLGWIEWDDGVTRPMHEGLLDSLELGYALTVHKSQGSQWRRVVICLTSSPCLIDRSLVYTALTRAQNEIILLGSHRYLVDAVARAKAADRRNVGLPKRLAKMLHSDSASPVLLTAAYRSPVQIDCSSATPHRQNPSRTS